MDQGQNGKPTKRVRRGSRTAPADLQVEEYRYCRELTLENVKAMDRNEIYTLGAVALTTGFSLASPNKAVAIASAFIPLALTYIARLRYFGLGIMVRSLDDYVATLEQNNHSIGWTQYQRNTGAGLKLRGNRLLFWRVLLLGSAAFVVFQVVLVLAEDWHSKGGAEVAVQKPHQN